MMNEREINRKSWIDVLRALAIIFVIYGHQLEKSDHTFIYYVFTSPVKIPLFLAISGYLFKDNLAFKDFCVRVVRGLVIPWLTLSLTPVLISSTIKGGAGLYSNVTAVLSGVSFWYMPCCIIAELVFYFLLKYCKRSSISAIVAVVLTAIGVSLIEHGILDVLMVNRALSVQLFLYLGYCIRKYEAVLDKIRTKYLWVGAIVYFCLGLLSIIVFPGECLDVHKGIYYNLPICVLMVLDGCTILFSFAKRYQFHSKMLEFIGRNTLVYYIWANYTPSIYDMLIKRIALSISNTYLSALVETMFTCSVCAVLAIIFTKYFPETVGKKRKRI